MFRIFKRRKIKQPQSGVPGCFSKLLLPMLERLNGWLSRYENKYNTAQKKTILLVFCSFIAAIHLLNICKINWSSPTKNMLPARDAISTPQDITLPDSLDVELIKVHQELKRKQDSLTRINKK